MWRFGHASREKRFTGELIGGRGWVWTFKVIGRRAFDSWGKEFIKEKARSMKYR